MLSRWDTLIADLSFLFKELKRIARRVVIKKKETRGCRPKHPFIRYLFLIAMKEAADDSLREAEVDFSRLVCGKRVDHSVIWYWEQQSKTSAGLLYLIKRAGKLIEEKLKPHFSMLDATDFTSWKKQEVKVYICNRIADGAVYPTGISFKKESIAAPTKEAVPQGDGLLYADAEFDDNRTLGVLFKKGYTPIVSPNKTRYRGYYRRKARKLYRMPEHRLGYRQRGRGESPFGSLTNMFGDRFKSSNVKAVQTRIAARVLVYQLKLLVRLNNSILLIIVRHAPK